MLFFFGILVISGQDIPLWQAQKAKISHGEKSTQVVSLERLGGVSGSIKLPKPGIRHTLSFEVRGNGFVQMGIYGSSAWAYSQTTELEAALWKTISLTYFERKDFFTVSLYAAQAIGAEFEFRNFALISQPQPDWAAVEIDRLDFEAEDYPGRHGKIQELAGASARRAVSGGRWYQVALLPVPASSAPLYFYCRSKKDSEASMQVNVAFQQQQLAGASIDQAHDWQWLKIGPLEAAALYPAANIVLSGEPDCQAWLDRIIISTNADLQDLELPPAQEEYPQGLLSIARSRQAPVIDGELDDACWEASVEVGPFILNRQNSFASEQTSVRFLYDDAMLYVAFHCQASCLVPAANRLHEFQNTLRENDSEMIWNDDCVLLLLWPDSSRMQAYDFVVNPAGFLCDSLLTAPDIWSQRDPDWNSEARVATSVGDGYWNVEMAIPLAKLPFGDRDNSKFMVGRIEKSRKEYSSWQILQTGFHNLEDFGKLNFVENLPSCQSIVLPELSPGDNIVNFVAKEDLRFQASLKFEPGAWQHFWNDSQTSGHFELRQNGKFLFQFSLAVPAQIRPFWFSPLYKLSARSLALIYQLNTGEFWLNNRPAKSGNCLNTGLNRLEIRAAKAVSGFLQVGEYHIEVDDSWIKEGESLKLNLLLEGSRVWPEWRHEGIHLNRGGVQQILFLPQGVEGFQLDDYTLFLEMPEDFILEGASGYYKIWNLEIKETVLFERQGKNYKRYQIRFCNKVNYNNQLKTHQLVAILVRAPIDSEEAERQFYFHSGSAIHGIREIPQLIPVKLLPPLNGQTPEKLLVQMWIGWLHSLDDKELYPIYAAQLRQMGITEANFPSGSVLKRFSLINFATWNFDCRPYLEKNPQCALLDKNGEKSTQFICSSEILHQPGFRQYLLERLPAWLDRWDNPAHVNWDYESRVMDSYISCFCPLCLQHFKDKNADIGPDLTPALIQQQYYRQWTIFMNQRMADLAGIFRDTLHQCKPGIVFSVYSGYQSDNTKHFYGVDWSMLHDKIDLGMCGYGRPVQDIEATRQALRRTPFVLGTIVYPYEIEKRTSPSWCSKAKLMRRVCDANGGLLIYEYPILDGRSFDSISCVSRVMSEFEPFFRHRDVSQRGLVELPGWQLDEYEVLRDEKNRLLLILMNDSNKAKAFQLTLPKGYQAVPGSGLVQPFEFVAIPLLH